MSAESEMVIVSKQSSPSAPYLYTIFIIIEILLYPSSIEKNSVNPYTMNSKEQKTVQFLETAQKLPLPAQTLCWE